MRRLPVGSQPRPVLSLSRTPIELALETASVITLMFIVLYTTLSWNSLPDQVPTHFGASGFPDSWGNKSSLLLQPSIAALLYVILTVIRNYPHVYNYIKPITPENAEHYYRAAQQMIAWIKFELIIVFTYIQSITITIAGGQNDSLGVIFIPIVLVVLFGTVGFYLIRLMKDG